MLVALAQHWLMALPTPLRKFISHLVFQWKDSAEVDAPVEGWWSWAELHSSGVSETLAYHCFFWESRLGKNSKQMECQTVLWPEQCPWEPRESFFTMTAPACYMSIQKTSFKWCKLLKSFMFNLKLHFNWDRWLWEVMSVDSVAYEDRILLTKLLQVACAELYLRHFHLQSIL